MVEDSAMSRSLSCTLALVCLFGCGRDPVGSSSPQRTSVTPSESAPDLVSQSLDFTTVSTGTDHSCGLTSAGVAYCWGNNF